MIWLIYILCGAGVMLALDDDRKSPLGFVGLLAALISVVLWPMMFHVCPDDDTALNSGSYTKGYNCSCEPTG